MVKQFYPIILLFLIVLFVGCGTETEKAERVMHHIVDNKVHNIRELLSQRNKAYWDGVINGDKAAKERYQEIETDFLNQFLPEEDFGNAMGFYEIQIDNLYGNREDYKFLQKVKASDIIKDEYLKREISMLYNYYLHYQMSPKLNEVITEKHSAMVKQFRNYAFPIWGDTLSQIYAMRKRRGLFDVDSIKEISYGICAIGDTIMPGFKQLIKYRNKMARSLGYKNYYELELESSDQNPATIQKLIDTLEILTREPYRDWMGKAKNKLSEIYHIPEDSVSYWHFYGSSVRGMRDPYPEMDSVDYLARTVSFFRGINIPVDSIVDRSIISFSPKNNNHYSFFMPFDNNKDGRVYVNTENSFVSLYYMFHELGHAVHDEYVDESIPYLLRDFNLGLTEGVAMFFDGLLDEPRFLYEMGFIDSAVLEKRLKSYAQYKRKAEIRRVRNKLMILEFENSIYTNPEQDFNGLWWDLVRKYEMLDVPDQKLPAAWSSVRHIILQSGYFQNYLVGDLIAAQFLQYIKKNCYTEGKNLYVGNKEIGKFFREKVFYYGNAKNWYQLIEEATGEKLNAGYYLDYLVEKE